MAEETVVAESSAAAAAAEPKFTQFDGWDTDGNPVVSKKAATAAKEDTPKPKPADAAAADTSKETKPEDAADSGAKKTQEKHRKPDAEARIKELSARAKQLEKELEEARRPKETKEAKAESSPARQTEEKPALPGSTPGSTTPRPTLKDVGPDGKLKYASFEDHQEALMDWKVDQKLLAQQRQQQATQQQQALNKHLEEARGRYTDFESVTNPLISEMMKPDIPREVFAVINDSPVLADLLYTLGGTEATKADFLEACRTNPGKAIRVALLAEQEIAKELGKSAAADKGRAAAKKDGEGEADAAPAAIKPRAPKPPSEVGGRGATGEDALISAAKSGDFRSFDAEQTRRALASRR